MHKAFSVSDGWPVFPDHISAVLWSGAFNTTQRPLSIAITRNTKFNLIQLNEYWVSCFMVFHENSDLIFFPKCSEFI